MESKIEEVKLVTTTAKWMESLLELAEKVKDERKKYEQLMIDKETLAEFQQFNNAVAQLAGYASSAKYILKDNES